MKKLLITIVLAGLLSLLMTNVARALLQDTEYIMDNQVRGATINLQVGDNDPSTVNFVFNNVQPGEIREFSVPIANVGGIGGNFWMEVQTDDSQEGDNPEAETDTLGEGELDDCAEIWIGFENDNDLSAQTLDWTPVNTVGNLEEFWGNNVDSWVNVGIARFQLKLRADNCGVESMGDMFDLNLIFHLDQI